MRLATSEPQSVGGVRSAEEPRRVRRWCAAALAVLAAATAGACGSSTGATDADVDVGDWGGVINPGGDPVHGGTLRIDQAVPPPAVSPLAFLHDPSGGNATIQVIMPVFDRLVELLPGSIDPQPGLARSWEISDDGLTYTFHLRDAEFSNGLPVTSADVKFVLERARDSFFADLFGAIAEVRTPDQSTAIIELSEPVPALLHYLAFPGASIVPATRVKEIGVEKFNDKPIGSGPFVLESWKRDQEVVLTRNENYWQEGLPYLDEVTLTVTPNANTRLLNLQSGNTDVANLIPFQQVETINREDSAEVLVTPGADMNVIFMNNEAPPYDEQVVRQALNYATPIDSIIDVVFRGLAPRMNTVIPKLKYWTEEAEAYPHDVERARELLAESSVPDGFSTSLIISGDDQPSQRIAEIVKEAWTEIGVEVKIRPLDSGVADEAFSTGNYELWLPEPGTFTSDVPVDDQFATLVFNSPQIHNLFTWYDNPTTERLAKEAVTELDEDARAELFRELHIASMKDPAVIPIAYTPNRTGVRSIVRDYNYLLNGWSRLETVWLEQ